jgi:hypothetical protein
MTLEDTRALAGHKLVCELLQKSLGLWIEWIDSYHFDHRADPKDTLRWCVVHVSLQPR